MLYTIVGTDYPDSLEKRMAARPDHIKRLKQLQADGRLIIAGPNPAVDSPDPGEAGFSGSLIIAEFDSLEQAQQWASEDPYIKASVYQSVEVKPYIQALP